MTGNVSSAFEAAGHCSEACPVDWEGKRPMDGRIPARWLGFETASSSSHPFRPKRCTVLAQRHPACERPTRVVWRIARRASGRGCAAPGRNLAAMERYLGACCSSKVLISRRMIYSSFMVQWRASNDGVLKFKVGWHGGTCLSDVPLTASEASKGVWLSVRFGRLIDKFHSWIAGNAHEKWRWQPAA
jgi:hypothetical protein